MAPMINPFDAGGYTLAEMTTAINILPNIYTRLGEMGVSRAGLDQDQALSAVGCH